MQTSEISDYQVSRLDAVVINTNDPDGFISLYRDKFGIRLALDKVIEEFDSLSEYWDCQIEYEMLRYD